MQMSFGLWQEQMQKLVMTPELRQAITILQLSSQELFEYLDEEVANNPVIEWDSSAWEKMVQEQEEKGKSLGRSLREAQVVPLEAVVSSPRSLLEHLLAQIHLLRLPPLLKKVVQYMAGNLDANGYLTMSTSEIAAHFHVEEALVERALHVLHTLEPTGVGARSLGECLLLQLREKGKETPFLRQIILYHLQDLADAKYAKIAASLGRTAQEVQEAADLLKSLDPKPGRSYSAERPVYVVPDLEIERVGNDYVVLMNEPMWPYLRINEFYRGILNGRYEVTEEVRAYVTGKLHAALWLMKSLEQRRQTIYKVTQAIVEWQKDFFAKGISALQPLTLRQIAEQVGVHESTVSRAVTGKYAQTPRGVLELKFFFASGLANGRGEGITVRSIKEKIKQWIAGEDARKPLSDQKLVDLLAQEGIHISRRTVAKYRDELRIPSSAKRKRL